MKNLRAEKVEILKTKVKLTISLDVNIHNVEDSIKELLNLAIANGESPNILKAIFDANGKIKINSKHRFI
tara:strand:- start:296 stop:505 length:210 start_codon:yes stop_codon:yes gene_type:complete